MIDRRRVTPVVAGVLLAALVAGFWALRVHVDPPPPAEFSINDIGRYFYPAAVSMHRDLQEGSLSLWNPYQMAGMPFLATQQPAQLYPPNLVVLTLWSPETALEVLAILHLFIAGFFTWLLARRLSLGFAESTCASVTYMLSGAMLAMFYAVAYVETCAWLPAVVWATDRLVRDARPRDAAVLSIVLAFAFLGGYAQGFVFQVQFGAAYGVALIAFGRPTPARVRVTMLAFLSALVMAGLVAAQLLPTLELLQHLPRTAEGLSLVEAGAFPAEPTAVLQGLVGEGTRFATTVLALPLIACGLLARRHRRAWVFFATAALVTGLFAIGERGFVFRVYHALPGGDLFRFPYRIAFVYAFCLSVLAALGVAGIREGVARLPVGRPRVAAAVAALVVVIVIVDFHGKGHLPHALPIPPEKSRGAPDALLAELESRRLEGRVFNENFGFQYSILMPYQLGLMNRIFAVPTYEPMIPRAYAHYFGQDRLWRGFINVVRPEGSSFGSSAEPSQFPQGGLVRLLDLMSVRFYAAHEALAQGRVGELEGFAGGRAERLDGAYLVERRGALPRAYLAHEQIVEPDPELARQRLFQSEFEPNHQVVVERFQSALEPAAPDAGTFERVDIVSYESGRVAIEARCRTSCLLVLTDLDYPGWEARVDGESREIHRVNTLFRGLVLAPGTHQVEYLYRPRSFRIGAAFSVATLVLGVVAGGFGVCRRSRGRTMPDADDRLSEPVAE